MPRQIQGSQWNFSFGEVDVALKRADDHPARKGGLRQMANARILNSGGLQDRPGRRALYPVTGGRTERFSIVAGQVLDIQFSPGRLRIINAAGVVTANIVAQGNGAALPWQTTADINSIVYAILGLSIYITFGHSMRPQVLSFDGVATWSMADYTEFVNGAQKRTPFYRISPQGIAISPHAQTGSGVTIGATGNVFTPLHVGTRIRFIGRQILITAYVSPINVTGTIEEPVPGSQVLQFSIDPSATVGIGDEVIGATSGAKGLVVTINGAGHAIGIQLISTSTTTETASIFSQGGTFAFINGETIAGPGGSLVLTGASVIGTPSPVTFWDEEVMNDFRGYPASVFVDQFRLGFCDFPSVPNGIAWSAINSPTDLYVGANPASPMFELAPAKVRVYYIVPGPEGSEFVFCDRGIFYIPISETNPLKPGSVAFKRLSGDGSAQVQPRLAQEAILYANAGASSIMAIIATGAYLRPYNTKNLSDYHFHLFNGIVAIAAPGADGSFNERYAYVLNGDGSIAVGKYDADTLPGNQPVIGWGPWSGAGAVSWIGAFASDVIFTSSYFGSGVVEILDDSEYLDCALPVNALPAAFAAPAGHGPLWFVAGQSVTLIDQITRAMGTYQVDATGFIVPQNNGGEDLTRADLVAGQPWTMIVEPFASDASPGADMGQRMKLRQISNFSVWAINSSGLMLASLFSAMQTATSPPLGTVMSERRFPAWNQGDDVTKPPTLRETVYLWTPPGSSFDPRAAIIKDTPGPMMICEIGMEISL